MRGAGFYTVSIDNQGPEDHNESPSVAGIDEEINPSSMPLGIDVRRANRHYFSADEMRAIFEDKFETLKKRKLNLFFYIGFHEPHPPLDKKRGRQLLGKPGGTETAFSPSKLDGEFMAASYDANIEHVTEELTKLISYLRQKGEYSNSLIVVFSDHGEEFLEHGSVYHQSTLYRELTDVVLLFKFPREFGAGRKLERLTSLLDIAPTILDAVDVEIPVTFEGASILPLIRSHSSPVWRSYVRMDLLFRQDNIRFALESDRYKYIYNFFNGTEELYDLREDRFEANNIVSQEGRTAREMKLLLFNWKSYDELRSQGMWPNK
jgi:arylsulfatase A-like enzyme